MFSGAVLTHFFVMFTPVCISKLSLQHSFVIHHENWSGYGLSRDTVQESSWQIFWISDRLFIRNQPVVCISLLSTAWNIFQLSLHSLWKLEVLSRITRLPFVSLSNNSYSSSPHIQFFVFNRLFHPPIYLFIYPVRTIISSLPPFFPVDSLARNRQ